MPRKSLDQSLPERVAMIAQTQTTGDWQAGADDLITSPAELFRLLDLDPTRLGGCVAAAQDFPLRVPRSYVRRMTPGDPQDPLLLQVLGQQQELVPVAGFSADPLQESEATPVPGVLHKYHGRVLLMVTGACAIHCRYCFRRHFPYQEHLPTAARFERALAWLEERQDISEVILSGGDPLSLSDRRLRELFDVLARIDHVKRLRIHTRLPVVMPERISEGLCEMLAAQRRPVAVVLHANHVRELDVSVARAAAALSAAGTTLLNQAVLLAGVNDSLESQVALAEGLYDIGVLPYYLHQLDAVAGAAHFAVADPAALALHAAMRERLPGYLLPRLVREEPGGASKTPLL